MGVRKLRQAYRRKRRTFYGNQSNSSDGNEDIPLLSSIPRPLPEVLCQSFVADINYDDGVIIINDEAAHHQIRLATQSGCRRR
eukprot:Seg404.3 transcript_id=Seg404.3/GoldUCD/mRNA.D3Y31 product="hypothetical protein" pseudo=true protein_id=Seg404.3/GoldUCD/D3Y31